MRIDRIRLLCAATLVGLAAGAVPSGDDAIDEAALLTEIGFSSAEIQKIARGETVAKTTQADASAVALAAATTVSVPAAFYLERFRRIESFKQAPEVLQIGTFGREPSPTDMAGMTLESADVGDLKRCRVGDCDVKLDAAGIAAVASRDARIDTASAAMRVYLAAYTKTYLRDGDARLIEYQDSTPARPLVGDLRFILEHSAYLRRWWPVLFDAIGGYHGTVPPGLDAFVYWSKEKIGPRAVVSVTHVIIQPPRDGSAAIASKQIYATHYGYASLGITILLDRSSVSAARTRVIYVNRSRLDIFGGIFGGIKRALVRSRAREGAERAMTRLRERIEREYASRQ